MGDSIWLLYNGEPIPELIGEQHEFNTAIIDAYQHDTLFRHIIGSPDEHPRFTVVNGFLYTRSLSGNIVMAVPRGVEPTTGKSLRRLVIKVAHQIVGHFGLQKTSEYVRQWY